MVWDNNLVDMSSEKDVLLRGHSFFCLHHPCSLSSCTTNPGHLSLSHDQIEMCTIARDVTLGVVSCLVPGLLTFFFFNAATYVAHVPIYHHTRGATMHAYRQP